MFVIIFGIIFYAMIYFYSKSKDEKKLREKIQKRNSAEKVILEYQLEESKKKDRIRELATKIKNNVINPINLKSERTIHTFTSFNEVTHEKELKDVYVTIIEYEKSKDKITIKVFEETPYPSDLIILYRVFSVVNPLIEDRLTIDNLIEISDSDIIDLFNKMIEKNNLKA